MRSGTYSGGLFVLTGKFWIIDRSCCIDVTCSEHALYARNYMLRLLGTPGEIVLNKRLFHALTKRELAFHKERKMTGDVLAFLSQKKSDARIYAIENYGWIRTRQKNFYLWQINATAWLRIRRSKDFWKHQHKLDPNDAIHIWEMKSKRWFFTTVQDLTTTRTFSKFRRTLEEIRFGMDSQT